MAGAGPVTAIIVVVVPPVLLAAAGIVHPQFLTMESARTWQYLHVLLLPVFPLLGLGFVVPLRRRPGRGLERVARVVAWLGAFTYAVFYTGLDLVAGFSAGTVARNTAAFSDLGAAVQPLFNGGDAFGRIGVYGFLVAVVAMTLVLYLRHGRTALPGGGMLLAAGWSLRDSHIFWPRGVLTMLAIAVGFGLSAAVSGRPSRRGFGSRGRG